MEPNFADWLAVIASSLTAIAAIAAAFIASKAPERAAEFAETRRAEMAKEEDLRRFRMFVFQALMKGRRSMLNPDTVAALNLVDVAFHDCQSVRSAYRLFIAATESSVEETLTRFHTLVAAVASEIGFAGSIHEDDLNLGFYPNALRKIDLANIQDAEERLAQRAAARFEEPNAVPSNMFDAYRTPRE